MKTPRNQFKRALKAGKPQYGFWLGMCNPLSAELCAYTGYDWLLIDGEHAPNDLQSTLAQLQAISGSPAEAIVRLVDDTPSRIKQYLDIGVQSLLVPMIETGTQAQRLAQSVQYPPAGMRGVGTALARAARWNQVESYFTEVDKELCLIAQIESVKAIENLDDILNVERIDAYFIGPADLAGSMGYLGQPGHPQVVAAIEDVIKKIITAGKPVGTLATTADTAQHYTAMGVQFIALGVDTLALTRAAKSILVEFHRDDAEPPESNGAY